MWRGEKAREKSNRPGVFGWIGFGSLSFFFVFMRDWMGRYGSHICIRSGWLLGKRSPIKFRSSWPAHQQRVHFFVNLYLLRPRASSVCTRIFDFSGGRAAGQSGSLLPSIRLINLCNYNHITARSEQRKGNQFWCARIDSLITGPGNPTKCIWSHSKIGS